MKEFIESLNISSSNYVQIGITLFLIVLFFIVRLTVSKLVHRHSREYDFEQSQVFYIVKLLNVGLLIILFTLISFVWEISWHGLSIYFVSIFTVIGIAFFAQWSILSNITASVILFFYFPLQVGAHVKIFEGDNSIQGEVLDITLFSIKIQLADGNVISYPNNLAVQKPIIRLNNPEMKETNTE